ncbi:helix-turn-helix domain-containing protein [Roseovarius tibetensis]|uniref:helix-turn-helix domain-containing protein n=1 Tax=Roseovarius tibetensis TaxID=2685897 RepID=UPI003D7F7663
MDRQNETLVAAFAVALSGEREKAQLTQEELAERADVSARFISFLETGRRQPSLSTLYALSKGLHIRMQDLIAAVERHHDADTVDADTVGPRIPSD